MNAGERVKAGTVLVELDKDEITAQVRRTPSYLDAADDQLLKRAYDRAVNNAKDRVVSQTQLDDAQKNYEMSLNKQQVAKANLVVLKAKGAQADAQVMQAQASLKQLEEQLGYTTITA